jgi:hypothetical protein
MDGPEDAERKDRTVGRIVAAAGEHADDREDEILGRGDLSVEARTHVGDVAVARACHVGAELKVARILGGLTADQAWLRRADRVAATARGVSRNVALHRLGELVVECHVLDDVLSVRRRERLEIRAEEALRAHVGFRLLVEAGVDRVVRSLEQAPFAIFRDFQAGVAVVFPRQSV